MFCPQCRAEYREGYTRCTTCEVDLVAEQPMVTHEEDLWAAPSVVIWEGQEPAKAEEIRLQLQFAGIPAEIDFRNSRDVHEVKVFPATEVLAREVMFLPPETFEPTDVLAAYEKRTGVCPLCGLDFYWNARMCGRCLVELIPPDGEDDDHAHRLGTVHHPGDALLVFNKLRRAGIGFHMVGMETGRGDIIVPRAPLQTGKYSFWVLEKDFDRAEAVFRGVPLQEVPFEAAPSLDDGEDLPREDRLIDHAAVWQGSDREFGEALRYALRENEIDSVLEESPTGALCLLVPGEDAERAKPIVRQVVEGVSVEEYAALDEGETNESQETH